MKNIAVLVSGGGTNLQALIDAEKRGDIKPGMTLLDYTSGNTGIGEATFANAKGYKLVIVIQPGVSA